MYQLPRIYRPRFPVRHSRKRRYVIPFDEAFFELENTSRAFFFYPQGLKDAIEITLATACVPDDYYYTNPNHILCDLENWIDREYNTNTAPMDLCGLFTNVKIAAEVLEEYVLRRMQQFFCSTNVFVEHVEPMYGSNMHYIVTVDF